MLLKLKNIIPLLAIAINGGALTIVLGKQHMYCTGETGNLDGKMLAG